MSQALEYFDLVLTGGRVIDPANGIDDQCDVAVKDGVISAVAKKLPPHQAKKAIRRARDRARLQGVGRGGSFLIDRE